jgi:preprotein translocase subunit SecE
LIQQLLKKIQDFFQDSLREFKKVIFPSLDEVIGSTKVVIITVLIIAIFLGIIDMLLSRFVGYIIK